MSGNLQSPAFPPARIPQGSPEDSADFRNRLRNSQSEQDRPADVIGGRGASAGSPLPVSGDTPQPDAVHSRESREREGGAEGSAGLVFSSTSDTRFLLDPKKSRLNRMKRGVMTAARLHQEEVEQGGFRVSAWFVSLTYREGVDWGPRHVSDCLKRVRHWCEHRGIRFRYVWVSEIQEGRRARYGGHCLHYHLMIFLSKRLSLPKFDKQGWWKYGMTQTVRVKARGVAYITKYASKGSSKAEFPKRARIHGCGGLQLAGRDERAWWLSPSYVREQFPEPELKPRRASGGGWMSKLTGEWIPGLFRIVSVRPLVIERLQGVA